MLRYRGDLNLLTVFLEVYRLRSITLAADSLGLTQPAVSSALKRLRRQIGADLFVRAGRGIAPTSTADHLADELSPKLQSIDRILANLSAFDISEPRTFRVCVTEPMVYLLHHHFEQSGALGNCRIAFELAPKSTDELLKMLNIQHVDLAIDITSGGHPSYLTELFHCDDPVLICSRAHPRIDGTISLERFGEEQHVALELGRSGLKPLDLWSREPIRKRTIALECNSLMSIIALVSNGQLLGCVPKSLAERYADRFELQVLDMPFEVDPIRHYLIAHKRLSDSPAHNWLRGVLKSTIDLL